MTNYYVIVANADGSQHFSRRLATLDAADAYARDALATWPNVDVALAGSCDQAGCIETFRPIYTYWANEDPDEIAPCIVCGEPKPNRVACDCLKES